MIYVITENLEGFYFVWLVSGATEEEAIQTLTNQVQREVDVVKIWCAKSKREKAHLMTMYHPQFEK